MVERGAKPAVLARLYLHAPLTKLPLRMREWIFWNSILMEYDFRKCCIAHMQKERQLGYSRKVDMKEVCSHTAGLALIHIAKAW